MKWIKKTTVCVIGIHYVNRNTRCKLMYQEQKIDRFEIIMRVYKFMSALKKNLLVILGQNNCFPTTRDLSTLLVLMNEQIYLNV